MADLEERLRRDILVLDGAMGTMIMRSGLTEADFRGESLKNHSIFLKGCNDILCITRPDLIYDIHKAYLNSGADIISTDTFNANRLSLRDYGVDHLVAEICREGASVARKAIDDYCIGNNIAKDKRPYVAGSMGPTGISMSIAMQEDNIQCDFDTMASAYLEQALALIEGGADILLLETSFDILNAKAAVYGILNAFEKVGKRVPLMISATLTEQGRLLSGQSLCQFVYALEHAEPISFGINCSIGAKSLMGRVQELSEVTSRYISVHPNAGLPDAMGRYSHTPEIMASEMRMIIEKGIVNIVGGCCGTTPGHIRLIAKEAKKYPPRVPECNEDHHNSFIKVGERCNVAGSRKFLRLINESNFKECLEIAADQIDKGASILDLNMDDPMLDAKGCMVAFIKTLISDPRTSSVPLMIDSSDFNVISSALRYLPIKGIVNSISLKNGEEKFIANAKEIHKLGCSMVVMAFDEKGQADTFERRIEICDRAYKILTEKAGIPSQEIVFDPNVLAVATGIDSHANYALDFIRTVEWIKRNLPCARVSGGVSNLSFSFRGIDPVRKAMHSIFLEHCISAGMDMAIINPATPLDSEWVDPELHELIDDVLLNRRSDSTDRLVEYASEVKRKLDEAKAAKKMAGGPAVKLKPENNQSLSANETLARNLILGDTSSLDKIIEMALKESGRSAMAVVNNALMEGMNRVGEKFATGELFLPQVVRSATFMKKAVDLLTPEIEAEQTTLMNDDAIKSRPLIVLATVKGDVHDIGKNIVSIVMRCSGFEVLDLGVMTPAEDIIKAAIENKAVAIGLSGLITPSLHEMTVVASMMEENGLKIPLFVGGATTSDIYTAVKIAPVYSGAVVHTVDAASLPGAVTGFTSDKDIEKNIAELKRQQSALRDQYNGKSNTLSLEEARRRSALVTYPSSAPKRKGEFLLKIRPHDVIPLINWRAFLHEWGLDPTLFNKNMDFESLSEDDENGKILKDAIEMLKRLDGSISAKIVITDAHSDGDNIIIKGHENYDNIFFPTLRTLTPNPVNDKCLSISDFIYGENDHIGIFCVTVAGSGIPKMIENLKRSDEYKSLLLQSLSHRLAEAATEWTHRYVREYLWGIPENMGIRPAIGYGSLPDQSLIFLLDKLLDYSSMGIRFTEHGALFPSGTTTGLIIAHPKSRYFNVGEVSTESLEDYAGRRGVNIDSLKVFLGEMKDEPIS